MRKISNLEFLSLIVIILISTFSGININIIKNSNGINGWISVLLSYFIGIIPLLLYLYISKYKENLSLNDKIKCLFKKHYNIINFFLSLILINIGMILLFNSNNFIISQLLYRTPAIMINILIILLAIYHNSKGINSITRVSFILLIINIFLFFIAFISLSYNIKIDNFLPFLKENTNHILLTSIKIASITTLPIIITLCIPKNQLSNPNAFNKHIIISYIISSIISFIIVLTTYGILGIDLLKIYEYPEYIVLKKVKLFNFLERIENIISNIWIIGNYIYITLIMYYININASIALNKKKNNTIINFITGVLLIILSTIIFKNNTIFHNYVEGTFPYLVMLLFVFYIIISLKIFITNKNNISKITT